MPTGVTMVGTAKGDSARLLTMLLSSLADNSGGSGASVACSGGRVKPLFMEAHAPEKSNNPPANCMAGKETSQLLNVPEKMSAVANTIAVATRVLRMASLLLVARSRSAAIATKPGIVLIGPRVTKKIVNA